MHRAKKYWHKKRNVISQRMSIFSVEFDVCCHGFAYASFRKQKLLLSQNAGVVVSILYFHNNFLSYRCILMLAAFSINNVLMRPSRKLAQGTRNEIWEDSFCINFNAVALVTFSSFIDIFSGLFQLLYNQMFCVQKLYYISLLYALNWFRDVFGSFQLLLLSF